MNAQKTETAKTQGDFYFDDNGDYLARFANGVVYYRNRLRGKPLTGDQVAEVNLWAVKMKADILHKVDASDFEAHDAGGEKLLKELGYPPFPVETELDKTVTVIAVNAFGFCKEAVPLLVKLVWKDHIADKHLATIVGECDNGYCPDVRELLARMDADLFQGTMADEMDDVKPVVGEG